MTVDHRIEQLEREFGFHPDVAFVTAEANGICSYCGEDLLSSRPGYSSIRRDRLIPEYEGEQNNDVLACASCKEMKANFSPLHGGDDADRMLRQDKDQLVQRVRTHLQKRIIARKSEWYRVKDIIEGRDGKDRDGALAAHAAGAAFGGSDGRLSRTTLHTVLAPRESRKEKPSRTATGNRAMQQ